ncbi:electron carrier/ protein disulfide oxidoreductase [Anaeramoeba flamelloides]|uniref:Electron carrier/ protein disulfide oxidoreductase n=1 Tax=Anaeramoeba flamelloides TaxID=1746091 RepID=A0AAV7Y928_9EUKA|nr:electron carrier/ protein disulfide oxidoreductase [Anaeramoeba flamelloides]
MGNITQIDKNIPKLSTKQFDRTFRRRNLTNECVVYVDKSCKIFRVTECVLKVIPFQKNKLLYYPIEHICPETQPILNLKTKTALNTLGIQACNNTEGTLDIIWSFREPNTPTLALSKSFVLQNSEKKQSTTNNKKEKNKTKKSNKKAKTMQKKPKLDGEIEIENCQYVEEKIETGEEEKNQEKEEKEITQESETNEEKNENNEKNKSEKEKTKNEMTESIKKKKTETVEEKKQKKEEKEKKTGKKIKKKRIKKKINKNTNKKRGLDDFDLESNKKMGKNKLIWTILGITPFNLDGKIIFQAKVKKIKKPKELLRMREIITKKQMQVNDLQKEVNELIKLNENKEEKKQIYTIQQESGNLMESATNIRKLKKKLELEILDLEEKIELREKEKLKMQAKENEDANRSENENKNKNENENENKNSIENESTNLREKENKKEKDQNNMKKKMSFRNFHFESKSKIELPTEPKKQKSFQSIEVERYLNATKKKKLKLKYKISRLKEKKMSSMTITKIKTTRMRQKKVLSEKKRMKKEILGLEKEIEQVKIKIELVESQSKSDIMNSTEIQAQSKKLESLQSSINWTQSKIERVSQKIKGKLKDNYLETECNTAQRNLKKIIQNNNILQLEISKYRYYVPDTMTQEDQDSFDTLSDSASTGLKSLDAEYLPEKRSLGLSEEIYNDKIKNKETTIKFEIQNSGSFDLALRQENMPSTLQKTFSTEWSPIRTKKNRTEFRTRLSPIISSKRLKRRNLSEKSILSNQKRRTSFDLKTFEKKNISRKFPMKKFGNLTIFETYLKFPLARKYFLEWLSEIYSVEIFLFYVDVQTFKDIYDQENAEYLCDHIIEMYINVGAIFEINIEDEERDKILNQWELHEYSIDLFDEINEKAFNSLKNDYFASYISSANFLELVEADSKQNYQLNSNSYLNGNFTYEQQKANILNNEFTFIGETRDPGKLCEELMWNLIDLLNSNYSYITKNFNLESLCSSLEYKKFLIGCSELKMIDLNTIISYETAEKKSFFINLYNIMSVHYLLFEKNISKNKTVNSIRSECKYEIGNEIWTLQDIADHFLKFSPPPKKKKKKITSNEKLKNDLSLEDTDPRIHFALFTFNNQPTTLIVYNPIEVDEQLRSTLVRYLNNYLYIDDTKKMIILPQIFDLYSKNFGMTPHQILFWLRHFILNNDPIKLYFYSLQTQKFAFSEKSLCTKESDGKSYICPCEFLRSGPNRHKKPNSLNDLKPNIQTHFENLNNEECAKKQISVWSMTKTKMLCFYWQIYDSKNEIQWLYLSVTVVSVPKEIMFQIVCQLTERPSSLIRSSDSSSVSQNKKENISINSLSNTTTNSVSVSNSFSNSFSNSVLNTTSHLRTSSYTKKTLSISKIQDKKLKAKLTDLSTLSQTSSQNSLNSSNSSFSLSRNSQNKTKFQDNSTQQLDNLEYEFEIEEKWDREVSKLKKLLRKSQMTEIERKGILSINHLQSIFNDSKKKNNHFVQSLINKNRKLKIQCSRKYESLEEHLQRRLSGYKILKNQYQRLLEENKQLKENLSYEQRKKITKKDKKEKEKRDKREKREKKLKREKEKKEKKRSLKIEQSHSSTNSHQKFEN